MTIKTLVKIWYSLHWRILVYSLTVYFLLVSAFSLIILYCINNELIDECRTLVLSLFGLYEGVEIQRFSYTRILIAESLNALITFPLTLLAMSRLPAIPFKEFRIAYHSLWQTFLIMGPIAWIGYVLSYLFFCSFLGQENETIQTALAMLFPIILIPYAFRRDVIAKFP
jgi:hypothetical protein